MSCCGGSKIKAIATGFAYLAAGVNDALSAQRMEHCNKCEHLRGGAVCNLCGCVVSAKTRVTAEVCPIKKW